MSRGSAKARRTASAVISVKVTLRVEAAVSLAASAMCQAIASPSRSGSVARNTRSAALAALRMLETTFLPFWVTS